MRNSAGESALTRSTRVVDLGGAIRLGRLVVAGSSAAGGGGDMRLWLGIFVRLGNSDVFSEWGGSEIV